MPSEVSDIKHFIEICRRKDASCTSFSLFIYIEDRMGIWLWARGRLSVVFGCEKRRTLRIEGSVTAARKKRPHARIEFRRHLRDCIHSRTQDRRLTRITTYSRADKAQPIEQADQVQGPMQPSPVHARAQGHGQGGEAEAESASRYVLERPMTPYMDVEGDGQRLAVGNWR